MMMLLTPNDEGALHRRRVMTNNSKQPQTTPPPHTSQSETSSNTPRRRRRRQLLFASIHRNEIPRIAGLLSIGIVGLVLLNGVCWLRQNQRQESPVGWVRRATINQNDRDEDLSSVTYNISSHEWQEQFTKVLWARQRSNEDVNGILQSWQEAVDRDILSNRPSSMEMRPYLLPQLPRRDNDGRQRDSLHRDTPRPARQQQHDAFFRVSRRGQRFVWQDEWDALTTEQQEAGPAIDYTNDVNYQYPPLPSSKQELHDAIAETYPFVRPLHQLLDKWPTSGDLVGHDNKSGVPSIQFEETLWHFDYTNATQMAMAQQVRDAELPFKLTNVPELLAASSKWTDAYLTRQFGEYQSSRWTYYTSVFTRRLQAMGTADESANHFFPFFHSSKWDVQKYGLPPTRPNDWSFAEFAAHARYADAVRLPPDHPHFYYNLNIPASERTAWARTFLSRDLPSFSSVEPNFIHFQPSDQTGLDCRFGERGVTAAAHYDGPRNMVGMISGAKRYILSPPNQCRQWGVWLDRQSPLNRHSMLNLNTDQSSEWYPRAAAALSIETVLKAGEVLYVPSYWFHYIISLQRSAQCNVRSGRAPSGSRRFGGKAAVNEQCHLHQGTSKYDQHN